MTIYYTARETFDKNGNASGAAWDGYVAWRQFPQLLEIVSLDNLLNEPLVEPDYKNADDWQHIVTLEQRMTGFYRSLEYVLKRLKPVDTFNLLALIVEPDSDCKNLVINNFEFVGYDLLDEWYDVSSLTNCDGFNEPYLPADINSFGLIEDYGKAFWIRQNLSKNNPDHPHANTYVVAVWRHKTLGRANPEPGNRAYPSSPTSLIYPS